MNTHEPPTQAELARRVGISQSQISRILAGKSQPTMSVAEAIALEKGVHVLNILAPDRYGPDGQPIPPEPDNGQE